MDITTSIISVYCIVDDFLKDKRVRQRRPKPTLSDSEVLAVEIAGEFLGIDTDRGIFRYFRRHFGDWFPAMKRIHCTTFVRRTTNLWHIKQQSWVQLMGRVEYVQHSCIPYSI